MGEDKGDDLSIVPFIIQISIGIVLLAIFFGPGADFINPFLESFGIDITLLRWPLAFVLFDILGAPSFFILMYVWDLYTKGGMVAGFVEFMTSLRWVGEEYAGPLTASFFDFIARMVSPPEAFFKIGIGAFAICTRGEEALACVGLDSAISIFGKELSLLIGMPVWFTLLLLLIWSISSVILSLPKFVNGLLRMFRAFIHTLFLILKYILSLFQMLFEKLGLDKPIEMISNIVETIDSISQTIMEQFSRLLSIVANMVKVVITIPVIYLPILAARMIIIFILVFFGTADLGIAVFATGLLFTIDGLALKTYLSTLIGALMMIGGLFMTGFL